MELPTSPFEDSMERDVKQAEIASRLFGPDSTPLRIGRFTVLQMLGKGGMGRVYSAYDEQLDRRVAIKVLRREVDEASRRRILREAKAMAKLSHPNVVQVFEVAEDRGRLFVAMELVQGRTLAAWQREVEPSWQTVLATYLQAGEGLAAAHAEGLVHRDFKPHNAMIDDASARVRVLDFGLARISALEDDPSGRTGDPSTEDSLTATGTLMGTPAYMAPEQLEGARIGAAADQYAWCLSLWEALYGEKPHDAASLSGIRRARLEGRLPEPKRSSEVPSWIREVLVRGLALRPDDRFASMEELLEAARNDPGARRARWMRWTGGTALVGAVLVGGALSERTPEQPCTGAGRKLDGVWDSSRRTEVEAAIMATELPFAETTWQRLSQTLDEYSKAWVESHTDACEATAIRREQSEEALDLRMECLHDAKVHLEAVTDVVARADASVVTRANRVARSLPPLDRCADMEALRATVAPPNSEEIDAVREVRSLLARGRVEGRAGRLQDANRHLEDARSMVTELEYTPVRAEVEVEWSRCKQAQGLFDEAEAGARRGLELALAHGQWSLASDAVEDVIRIVGTTRGKFDEALGLADVAKGLALRDPDPMSEAEVQDTIGGVWFVQGRNEEARIAFEQALELAKAALDPDDIDLARFHANVAGSLVRQGELDRASEHMRRSLRLMARLGDRHPALVSYHHNLSQLLMMRGDLTEALEHARASAEIARVSLSPDVLGVARARLATGTILDELGRYEEAIEEVRAARDSVERTMGAEHQLMRVTSQTLAQSLIAHGDLDEAERELGRAFELAQGLEPTSSIFAELRFLRGELWHRRGEHVRAEVEHREVLAIREGAAGPDDVDVGRSRHALGRVLEAQGRYEAAEAEIREALRIHGSSDLAEYLLANIRTSLARVFLGQGKTAEAKAEAEQAWSMLKVSSVSPHLRGRGAFALARALAAMEAEPAQVDRLTDIAESSYTDAGPGFAPELEEIRAWRER